jgi:hypothetical protein
MSKRKPKRPCFVKVRLTRDGEAVLTDDDGEQFSVIMRRGDPWPFLCRVARRFELCEAMKTKREIALLPPSSPPPTTAKFKVVK